MSATRLLTRLAAIGGLAIAALPFGISPGLAQHAHSGAMQHHVESTVLPTHPGQEAFGTIQEIVQLLDANPKTDWSKVNIAALRAHLIDMDDVTIQAKADVRALDDGVEMTVTGDGRTREALKRMVPAHARELAALGLNTRTELRPDGVLFVVTSKDKNEAVKLKALGFAGIMAIGAHHQRHHLMMAKGEFVH